MSKNNIDNVLHCDMQLPFISRCRKVANIALSLNWRGDVRPPAAVCCNVLTVLRPCCGGQGRRGVSPIRISDRTHWLVSTQVETLAPKGIHQIFRAGLRKTALSFSWNIWSLVQTSETDCGQLIDLKTLVASENDCSLPKSTSNAEHVPRGGRKKKERWQDQSWADLRHRRRWCSRWKYWGPV